MKNVPITSDKPSAGDPIPPKCSVIEVQLGELKQLFDAIDPSPFRDRDLDPKAEDFIVGWAKDLPRETTHALVVDLEREAGLPDEATVLRDAIHEFFRHRAERTAVSGRSFAKASRSAVGSPCGVRLKCSCTTGGRSAMKLDYQIGLRQCRCGSDI